MTYSLPFGLKQKPLNHYITNGVIKFAVREGKLFYLVKRIRKQDICTIMHGEVTSKQHLDQLLAVKSFNEIRTIEIEN